MYIYIYIYIYISRSETALQPPDKRGRGASPDDGAGPADARVRRTYFPLSPRTSSMPHVMLFSAFRFSMPSPRKISRGSCFTVYIYIYT